MKVICFATVGYFLLTSFCVAGQQLSDSLLGTFYNKTLSNYFADTTSNQEQIKFGCILIETSFDTTKLFKNVGTIKLRYFNDKTSVLSMINRPLKTSIGRNIYGISHETFGQDTVEVNIVIWAIENIKRNKIWLGLQCVRTIGHIPSGRFVFDRATNIWVFISARELRRQR